MSKWKQHFQHLINYLVIFGALKLSVCKNIGLYSTSSSDKIKSVECLDHNDRCTNHKTVINGIIIFCMIRHHTAQYLVITIFNFLDFPQIIHSMFKILHSNTRKREKVTVHLPPTLHGKFLQLLSQPVCYFTSVRSSVNTMSGFKAGLRKGHIFFNHDNAMLDETEWFLICKPIPCLLSKSE